MKEDRVWAFIGGVLFAAILAIAFWLRWRYIHEISLYVDEFTTLWAATRVQLLGLPRMPSGVLYTRGLLNSYIEALWLGLLGFSYVNGRLLSLVFGLATIVAAFFAGRGGWNARVGLLAALGLALLPEAIIWGGRARFYTQLQFFSLLTAWCAFVAIRTEDRRRERRWLAAFAATFVLALFSQEETLLLYPVVLLAMLLWRGWRYFLRPVVVICQFLCLAAIGLRYAIEIWGQPGYFETIQSSRPYVGLIFDVIGAWRVYGPLIASPARLAWTLFGLLAVAVAFAALRRVGWRLIRVSQYDQATLYFALLFVAVYVLLLALVGTSWREARYLLFVQPFWLLAGGAGVVWAVDKLTDRRALRWAITAAVGVLFATLFWPGAQETLAQQTEGYDLVLDTVAEQRQAGDVFLSPQPPACALVLGPCDYFAAQRGYEEFVIPRHGDGVPIDRWAGGELLNETRQLQQVISNGGRVWFITDSFRLATRYEPDFVRTVLEQFDVADDQRGVLALLANGWKEPVTPVVSETFDQPPAFGPLSLVGWERNKFVPGEPLAVSLLWQSTEPIQSQLNTSLQLVAEHGSRVAQADGPPARGIIPTSLIFDQPVPDFKTLDLPGDMAPGRYRLELSVYDVERVTPLTAPLPIAWFQVGSGAGAPQRTLDIQWSQPIELVGMDVLPETIKPGETLDVRLVWKAVGDVDNDYTAFVHLVDAQGAPIAQHDRAPGGAFYPTSAWDTDNAVEALHVLTVPQGAEPGEYRLIAGLYRADTGERVTVKDGETVDGGTVDGDTVVLQSLQVVPR